MSLRSLRGLPFAALFALVALLAVLVGPLARVASASPLPASVPVQTAATTPVAGNGGPGFTAPPFICGSQSSPAPSGTATGQTVDSADLLPINRWASAAGSNLHSDVSGGFLGLSSVPEQVQRDGIEAGALGLGNTLWQAATGLVSDATQFCVGDTLGLEANHIAETIGNAIVGSGLVAGLLALAVIIALLAAVRRGENPLRRLIGTVVALGVLAMMIAGSAPANSYQTGNGVHFGAGSPAWLISHTFQVVNTVASLPASVFNDASAAIAPGQSANKPLSCASFSNELVTQYKAAYQAGAAGGVDAALPIAINNLWEQTGLTAYTDVQFGSGNAYGSYVYCRLLEDDINTPPSTDIRYTAEAAAQPAYGGGAAYSTLASNSRFGSLAWAPVDSDTNTYVDRSIIGWAACRPAPGSSPPWRVSQSWVGLSSPSNGRITAQTCAQWYSGTSSMSGSPLDWGNDAQAIGTATSSQTGVGNFLLTFHGNNVSSGIATSVLYAIAAFVVFIVFAILSLAIIVAKVALLVLAMLAVLVAAFALIPGTNSGNRAISLAKHALGMVFAATGAQILLSLVALITGLIVSAGASSGGGAFSAILFTSFAPVAAIVLIHLLFTKVLRAPTPFRPSSALAYGAAAGGIGAGLGAGLDRLGSRARSRATTAATRPVRRGVAGFGSPRPERVGALRAGANQSSRLAEATSNGGIPPVGGGGGGPAPGRGGGPPDDPGGGAGAGVDRPGSGGGPVPGSGSGYSGRGDVGGGGVVASAPELEGVVAPTDRQLARMGRQSARQERQTAIADAGGLPYFIAAKSGEAVRSGFRNHPVRSGAKVAGLIGLAAVPGALPVAAAAYGAHKAVQRVRERAAVSPEARRARQVEAGRQVHARRQNEVIRANRTVTHEEATQARAANAPVAAYSFARRTGATREQVMEAHRSGAHLGGYGRSRLTGASHDETLEAHRARIDMRAYARARRVASHADILAAQRSEEWRDRIDEYATARGAPSGTPSNGGRQRSP